MLQSTQSLLTPGGDSQGRQNLIRIAGALREFQEETGIHPSKLRVIDNISPLEEIFTGSNYKSYCHKYFLAEYIDVENDSHKIKLSMKERPSGRICDTDAPLPLPRIRDFSDQKYPDWVGIHTRLSQRSRPLQLENSASSTPCAR
jgi:hypothetical protein